MPPVNYNNELSIYRISRSRIVLHFTPDAYNQLKGKSIDKKASIVIKPTSGLGARQLIVRNAKVQHRSNQAFLLKYPLPFIPSRVSECKFRF